jgi:hypothetical protein
MVEATGMNGMESRSPSMSSPLYKTSSKSTTGSKVKVFLYTHLRSLNVCHFGMAEATRLKHVTSRSP